MAKEFSCSIVIPLAFVLAAESLRPFQKQIFHVD
jgi:hypothetical protein